MNLTSNIFLIRTLLPVILCFIIHAAWGANRIPQTGDSVDFSLESTDGQTIQLKDYRGKKVVHLVFWSTWCPKCLRDMAKLKKIYGAKGTRPYEILTINVGLNESKARIKKIQEKYQLPFIILLDKKGELTKNFGVISIPYSIIIDKEGTVKDRFIELPKNPAEFFTKLFTD